MIFCAFGILYPSRRRPPFQRWGLVDCAVRPRSRARRPGPGPGSAVSTSLLSAGHLDSRGLAAPLSGGDRKRTGLVLFISDVG